VTFCFCILKEETNRRGPPFIVKKRNALPLARKSVQFAAERNFFRGRGKERGNGKNTDGKSIKNRRGVPRPCAVRKKDFSGVLKTKGCFRTYMPSAEDLPFFTPRGEHRKREKGGRLTGRSPLLGELGS